jgi:hypothetical protein
MAKNSFSTLDQHVRRFTGLHVLDPGIYCATFGSSFDMAMTMWRVQETFESQYSEECEGKPVLVDFMEWYSKNYGDQSYSYTDDFHGFNVSKAAIEGAYTDRAAIKDFNRYDALLCSLWDTIKANESGDDYFLMGVLDGDHETLEHELAHCYFSLDDDFRNKQAQNVRNLGKKAVKMYDVLTNMGYASSVVVDETQAYLSTGLTDKMRKKLGNKFDKLCKPFSETFYDRLKGTKAEKFVEDWKKRVDD